MFNEIKMTSYSPYTCRTPSIHLTIEPIERSRSREFTADTPTMTLASSNRRGSRRSASIELTTPKTPRKSRVSALISRMTENSPVRSSRPSERPPRLSDGSPVRSSAWTTTDTMSRSKTFDESSRRHSWKKETEDFEDELRSRAKVTIQKAENKLKLEALSDASKRYNMNNGDIGLDVKRAKISTTPTSPLAMPTFESKYRTLENKIDEKRFKLEQEKINENMPKKGSWRKEFAKFEDEMEIDKIRRENQKKIEMYSESNDSESRKENIAEIRIRPKNDEKEVVTRTETPMWEKENNRRAPPLSKPPR